MGCDGSNVFQGDRIGDYLDEGKKCSIHDQSPLFCSLDQFGRVGVVKTQSGGLVGGAITNHV
jgi:hypothetical protein